MNTLTATFSEATHDFLSHLFDDTTSPQNVAIRLCDGSLWPDESPRAATLALKHPGALRNMLAAGNANGLGESYLRDDFDVEGDIEQAVELALALQKRRKGWLESLSDYYRYFKLRLPEGTGAPNAGAETKNELTGSLHSPARDREAIAKHYDVSNEFYRLWLDRRMVYSCGYFEKSSDELDTAQAAKLHYLCRKLRLQPGQRLLDIGCGWGGLAIYAARHFGVDVTGVTLSGAQAELAAERVLEAGLGERIGIRLCDYRELGSMNPFDAIVSVGMSEHVGRDHLPRYFQAGWNLLKAGGVFLNHAIAEGLRADRFQGPSFVQNHVFPDADIPPLQLVLAAAVSAGFEVRDVENLREHYVLTLRHWVRRLEAAHGNALKFVNERAYRIWRLYLAASAHGFAHGDLALHQVLLCKPAAGGASGLPLTRRDWYA